MSLPVPVAIRSTPPSSNWIVSISPKVIGCPANRGVSALAGAGGNGPPARAEEWDLCNRPRGEGWGPEGGGVGVGGGDAPVVAEKQVRAVARMHRSAKAPADDDVVAAERCDRVEAAGRD